MKVRIKPEYCDTPEEARLIFDILEENGNRLIIRPTACLEDWAIKPTEKVEKYMVEAAK